MTRQEAYTAVHNLADKYTIHGDSRTPTFPKRALLLHIAAAQLGAGLPEALTPRSKYTNNNWLDYHHSAIKKLGRDVQNGWTVSYPHPPDKTMKNEGDIFKNFSRIADQHSLENSPKDPDHHYIGQVLHNVASKMGGLDPKIVKSGLVDHHNKMSLVHKYRV